MEHESSCFENKHVSLEILTLVEKFCILLINDQCFPSYGNQSILYWFLYDGFYMKPFYIGSNILYWFQYWNQFYIGFYMTGFYMIGNTGR